MHKAKENNNLINDVEICPAEVLKPRRFWELDFIRGLCVILMIFDHFMYSLSSFGSGKFQALGEAYWQSGLHHYGQKVVTTIFFVLCGIGCCLSHSNLKRGLKLGGVAVFLTFGTYILESIMINYKLIIVFGVLHMLSSAILLYALFSFIGKFIPKVGKYLPAFAGLILIILYFTCIKDREATKLGFIPALIGYKVKDFFSSDYYPILPYAGYVLLGSIIGEIFYKTQNNNLLAPLDGRWNKPVCFVGRNALLFYVAHQIVIVILIFLIRIIFKI